MSDGSPREDGMLVEASSIGGAAHERDERRRDWVWSESRARRAARITDFLERPAEILMVEDNPGDVVLTRRCLEQTGLRHRLSVVEDGETALAFLRQQGEHGAAPRPDLVLLDLDLPRRRGLEVLAEIKADPQLRRLPVVVLEQRAILHCHSRPERPVKAVPLVRAVDLFATGNSRFCPADSHDVVVRRIVFDVVNHITYRRVRSL